VKRNALHILDKSSLGHCLNQSDYVWSISTLADVGDGNVPHFLNNEVKCIELGPLRDGLEQIPLKMQNPRGITLSRGQSLLYDPVDYNHLRLEVCDGGSIEVRGLIHRCHLTQAQHIAIMKI
jgi:hypothetical protein